MSIFPRTKEKLFGKSTAPTPALQSSSEAAKVEPVATRPQSVDIGAILDGLAAQTSEKLNWKSSIVDLMKLLSIDRSLSARKQLAKELHYDGDANESAAMNIWLHKQLLKKLAEHGGKLPKDLTS
jgi:Domain of unknown function (DUF3597)